MVLPARYAVEHQPHRRWDAGHVQTNATRLDYEDKAGDRILYTCTKRCTCMGATSRDPCAEARAPN